MDNKQTDSFIKRAGAKIKHWVKNHRRRIVQLYSALLTNANLVGFANGKIYTGATKAICVPGLNCYSCPGAVGACPLGSLQNSLYASSVRTPVFVVGILMIFGLMLGRTICSFFCPMGLGQELLHKIPSPKLKKSRITKILSYFKYVLLVLTICVPILYSFQATPFFCKYICPAGTLEGGIGLLSHPENADKFGMLGYLFTWKFALLVIMVVASVFIYRFFCRFFCPLGAIYGFFNRFALIGVKLDKSRCTDCGRCITTCKMDITRVGDHECINCGECIPVCPTKAITWKGSSFVLHPSEIQPVVAGAAEMDAKLEKNNQFLSNKQSHSPQKYKKRRKILKIIGYSFMAITLTFALAYYNVILPLTQTNNSDVTSGEGALADGVVTVGEICPDFTLKAYQSASNVTQFTLSQCKSEVVVINFWYTACASCVAELPHFEEVYDQYGGEVQVVAVHSYDIITQPVQGYIDDAGWSGYDITFAHDNEEELYDMLGGDKAWPFTVVLDKNREMVSAIHGGLSKQKLIGEIEKAKQNA